MNTTAETLRKWAESMTSASDDGVLAIGMAELIAIGERIAAALERIADRDDD